MSNYQTNKKRRPVGETTGPPKAREQLSLLKKFRMSNSIVPHPDSPRQADNPPLANLIDQAERRAAAAPPGDARHSLILFELLMLELKNANRVTFAADSGRSQKPLQYVTDSEKTESDSGEAAK